MVFSNFSNTIYIDFFSLPANYRTMADKLLSSVGLRQRLCLSSSIAIRYKISIIFFSETTSPIDFKFGMQLPDGEFHKS